MRAEKSWKDSWAGPAKKVVGDKDILGRSEQLICNVFLDEQCVSGVGLAFCTGVKKVPHSLKRNILLFKCIFEHCFVHSYIPPIFGLQVVRTSIYASYSYLRVIYFVYPHRHHAFSASSDRGISTGPGNVHPCRIDRRISLGVLTGG
jgi:hypothetical protein